LFTSAHKLLAFVGIFATTLVMLQMVSGTEFATASTDTRVASISPVLASYTPIHENEYIPNETTVEYLNNEHILTEVTDYYQPSLLDRFALPDTDRLRTFGNQLEYFWSEVVVAAFIEEEIECDQPRRVVYLTFDDGPTRNVTPRILDTLAERGIHATFFVVGSMVRANPDIMQRIVDEGHTVGIHSDTHVYAQIYASLNAFINDFRAAQDLIAEFTGYTPTIYRFPGGSNTGFNARVRTPAINFLDEHGYVFFDWNASIDDSIGGNRTPAQLLARGLETTHGDKVIMLAHDTQSATAAMMGDLIDALSARGFVFDVLTSDVEPIHFVR